MKKKRWIILICIIFILIVVIGCYHFLLIRCKDYMGNENKCVGKCDFKSVIKREYECIEVHPPLGSEYGHRIIGNCECWGDVCLCGDAPKPLNWMKN